MFIKKKIIKQFHYLIDDFGYIVTEKSSFGRTIYVKFRSKNCKVYVYVEGYYVGLAVIPIEIPGFKDEESKTFEIQHLLDYIAPELNFKPNEGPTNLNKEIKRIADLFLKYCDKIIIGDFSIWYELYRKWRR